MSLKEYLPDLEKQKRYITPVQCKEYCEELKWRRFEGYPPWPREFGMGENISPHAGEEHGGRWHHCSSDERQMHFTATFNEGATNIPILISCQTNYIQGCVTNCQYFLSNWFSESNIVGSIPPLPWAAEHLGTTNSLSSCHLQRMLSLPQTGRHGMAPYFSPSELKLLFLKKN